MACKIKQLRFTVFKFQAPYWELSATNVITPFTTVLCTLTFSFDERLNTPQHGGYTHLWRDALQFFKTPFLAALC